MLLPEKKTHRFKVFPHAWGVISLVVGHLATLGCGPDQAEAKAPKPAQILASAPADASTEQSRGTAEQLLRAPHEEVSVLTFAHESIEARVPSSFGLAVQPQFGAWGHAKASSSEDQFWVFHQPARRTVTLVECESDARARLQVLRHGLSPTNERPWDPMPGYTGTLRVVLLQDGATLVEGFAVGISRCLSAAYNVKGGQDYAQRLRDVVLSVFTEFSLQGRAVSPASPHF